MIPRNNIFVIHSWEESPTYHRMMELLSAREAGVADYSLPPWKAVEGPDDEVIASIDSRISTATAVVVLNTPGIHHRPWSSYEMQTAVRMNKRIVVLQPHEGFWRPIPSILDDHLYRVAPWRSDVLGKAIRGDYPQDGRIFDIAEQAERRALTQLLAVGVGTVSIALLVTTVLELRDLQNDLAGAGIHVEWNDHATGRTALHALTGAALIGGLTALITEDAKAAVIMAVAGGLAGAAFGTHRMYKARLNGMSSLRVLTVVPASPLA
jgi:hypothetical protein